MAIRQVRFDSEANVAAINEETPAAVDGFNTSTLVTPSVNRVQSLQYRNIEQREINSVAPASTLVRPNYEDILRRVSVVIHQHVTKCEIRLSKATPDTLETGLFHTSKMEKFNELNYISPKYAYQFIRAPLLRSGFLYGIRKLDQIPISPTLEEVHTFITTLFVRAQLSAECSIGKLSFTMLSVKLFQIL